MENIETTETGLKYSYKLGADYPKDPHDVSVKLLSKVPRSYYHSCINEIGQHFDETVRPKLQQK
jgi:hypothetical protein